MQAQNNTKSVRHMILVSMLGLIFTFVFIAMLFVASIFLDEAEQQQEQNIINLTRYVSALTADDLYTGQQQSLAEKLTTFKAINNIQHIDIYQLINNNTQLVARYDYIKGTELPSSGQLSEQDIKLYNQPRIDNDIVRYALPIKKDQQTLGYVFTQIDSHHGLTLKSQLIITLSIAFIILLIIAFFIAFRLEQQITLPLNVLRNEILQLSKSKNYSDRVSEMPIKEFDFLARSINNFLGRIERQIKQLDLAEQQSLKLTSELETKVQSRTNALKESNQELLSTLEKLHQYQDQLVESEKMASLGDMVAGIAHEVNTPIGLGVTASTLLSDRLHEISSAFHDKTLKSSQLKRFLADGEENVGIIYRNLKRAAELISSFKKVAVDQSSEEFRQFNFSELLSEILLTLAPQIKSTPYQIDFDCPAELMVVSKPGPINQVMINLILNSITHGFDQRDHGSIKVKVMKLGEQLNIHYQDDGKGIDPAMKEKVFEPFTTTKRGEGGSGLGLHLVYNLVTQALGGNIRMESDLDKGVIFEINFPISEQLL
ncbi:ATP-binding protein [Thalassotalea sp. G2M2-11]|uniref:sensor histidine kinase n=1 Tax=Thalassotalea sp. G2M2-11 TaxID=2787627 RepID=UPI0019D07C71|nr:ATP-binding protein [Thalassotalea sp. G2M2-11]